MKNDHLKKTDSERNNSCPPSTTPGPQPSRSFDSSPLDIPTKPAVPRTEGFPPTEKNSQKEKDDDLHIRAGSLLARLTSDQRTQLFKWLLDHQVADVVNFVAAPAPAGFGIQTHKTTLRRLKGMLRSHESRAAFEGSSAAAELLTGTIRENRPQFAPLISELLLQKAFDLANSQNERHELKDLINSAIKLRELDLKVQRLQLLREKRDPNAARRRVHVKSHPPLTRGETDLGQQPESAGIPAGEISTSFAAPAQSTPSPSSRR
jgi:hypothetical protein